MSSLSSFYNNVILLLKYISQRRRVPRILAKYIDEGSLFSRAVAVPLVLQMKESNEVVVLSSGDNRHFDICRKSAASSSRRWYFL